ncbi:MAG: GGDEF domain-containing protein [Deltaproteobacteria bacterium]|nr:GGDEF domain-containing protein [Deltaproteobacteria bacterium]
MSRLMSLVSERFRTTFLVFYILSSLLPMLIMMYIIIEYVRPHLSPKQIEALMDPVTYGLLIMLVVPILGLILMNWWVKSLEQLTEDVKAKTAELLETRVEITDKNEIFSLHRHVDGLYGELKGKIAQLKMYSQELGETKKQIAHLSRTDELTTLYDRRYFDRSLIDQINKAEKGKYDLSLLMIDVNNFKLYNQLHGHAEGDSLLHGLGLLIKDYVRKIGLPFRYGGDKFAIILPKKDIEATAALANKLVDAAGHIAILPGPKGQTSKLSINCGVVTYSSAYEGLVVEPERLLREVLNANKGSVVCLTPKSTIDR